MQKAQLTEQYLERVIMFKSKKDLHDEYLEDHDREKLLNELARSLGFDAKLLEAQKEKAQYHFLIYQCLAADIHFDDISKKTYAHLTRYHLLKSIHLDPFNQESLKEYLFKPSGRKKTEKKYRIQYVQLFKPTSTEVSSLQVDLGIGPTDLPYDYLSTEIIGPFVNEMVFLNEQLKSNNSFTPKDTLEAMASEAGVDDITLKEIDTEVEEMLKLVSSTYEDYSLSWKNLHKAYMVVDKMLDLAPYNIQVLEEGIRFYGHTLWRILVDAKVPTLLIEDKKAFFKALIGEEKPSTKKRIETAKLAFEKARTLEHRFKNLPAEVFEKKDDDDFLFLKDFRSMMRRFGDSTNINQMRAFVDAQNIMFNVYIEQMRFRRNNFIFGIGTGAILYLAAAIFSQVVLGSVHFLWTFVMIPGMAAAGIANLRLQWWRKKDLRAKFEV